MSWWRVDDVILDHPRVLALYEQHPRHAVHALATWLAAGCCTTRHLSDGNVTRSQLRRAQPCETDAAIAALVAVGLLIDDGADQYRVYNWTKHNTSRDDRDRLSAAATERKRASRDRARGLHASHAASAAVTCDASHADIEPVTSLPPSRVEKSRAEKSRSAATQQPSRAPARARDLDQDQHTEADPPGWTVVIRLFEAAWSAHHGSELGLHSGERLRAMAVERWARNAAGDDWQGLVTRSADAAARGMTAVRAPWAVYAAQPGRWITTAAGTGLRVDNMAFESSDPDLVWGPQEVRDGG